MIVVVLLCEQVLCEEVCSMLIDSVQDEHVETTQHCCVSTY